MKQTIRIVPVLAAFLFLLFACSKESSQSRLRIRMTDAPAAYDEVNVDLKEVRVKIGDRKDSADDSQWISLDTRQGIYNLLDLQNGVDTLIAQGDLPQGRLKEIRLVLGSENTIVEEGKTYPLTIPSGAESGLKIKIDKKLQYSMDSVLIDFDALLSVKKEGSSYKLRPVIKVK